MMVKKQYVNWFPLFDEERGLKSLKEQGIKFISPNDLKWLREDLVGSKNNKLIILDDFMFLMGKKIHGK